MASLNQQNSFIKTRKLHSDRQSPIIYGTVQHVTSIIKTGILSTSLLSNIQAKNSIPEPQKLAFKDYLDNRGAQLAKTDQFLQFYALPFIKKPLQHPTFKNIFKKQWVTNLRQKLEVFITDEQRILKLQIAKVFNNVSHNEQDGQLDQKKPNISNQAKQNKLLQDKVKQMQKINKKLFEEVKQLAQKHNLLEDNHKIIMDGYHTNMMESQSKWFQITKQLVECSKKFIQMIISSNIDCLNDKIFIKFKKRTQKYQKFVNKKFDDLVTHTQDISILDKPSISDLSYSVTPHSQKNFHSRQNIAMNCIQSYIATNFQAIKLSLTKNSVQQNVSIINGLYWRILKSKSKQIRKLNILGIIHYDVLGIKSGKIQKILGLRQLIKPVIRLIQLISLDSLGKCLAFSNSLIKDLVGLVNQCSDNTGFQYIICTIAQISSEKPFKTKLINFDIIQVCMKIMRGRKYHNNQTVLQNTAAIMLNMLQKTWGLKKFQKQKDVFQVFKHCLIPNFKITRALIYGIIFALLQSQQLFKRANLQKLPQFFAQIQNVDPHINKVQLKYLRNKMAKFQPRQQPVQKEIQDQQFDMNSEDDQDIQIDEQYIQQVDQVMKAHDEVLKKFVIKGKDAEKQELQVKKLLQQYREHRVPRFHVVQLAQQKQNEYGQNLLLPDIKKHKNQTKQPQKVFVQIKSKNIAEKEIIKKSNNFMEQNNSNVKQFSNAEVKKNSNYNKNKPRQSRFVQDQERTAQRHSKHEFQYLSDERRMKKSVSADRGIGRNIQNGKIYHINKFSNNQKISEFKSNDKSYRSPPNKEKKPRQQVLKQLNQQIKAEQQIKQKRRQQTENHRENVNLSLYASQRQTRKTQQSQVFQSRPKLRRTPPKQ